jgi:TATA-binding protein-associated factor
MAFSYAKETADEEIPTFTSLEQWNARKSTKIDVCAQSVRHLLTRDDAPPVQFADGFPVFPPLPALPPGVTGSRNRRILIYQAFPSMGKLLRSVCTTRSIMVSNSILFRS